MSGCCSAVSVVLRVAAGRAGGQSVMLHYFTERMVVVQHALRSVYCSSHPWL